MNVTRMSNASNDCFSSMNEATVYVDSTYKSIAYSK